MPKNIARADYCFDKALGFLLKYWNMAIPDAMKLADFQSRSKHVTPSACASIAYGRRQM